MTFDKDYINNSFAKHLIKAENINQLFDTTDKNCWTKREKDWFDIETKLIFKNNVENIVEGDIKVISAWSKAI